MMKQSKMMYKQYNYKSTLNIYYKNAKREFNRKEQEEMDAELARKIQMYIIQIIIMMNF